MSETANIEAEVAQLKRQVSYLSFVLVNTMAAVSDLAGVSPSQSVDPMLTEMEAMGFVGVRKAYEEVAAMVKTETT